MPSQRFLHY